jgi:xylan 1,4-beta-xylosidase
MLRSICNPLNLAYRFQDMTVGPFRSVNREGADPSIVMFKGRLYLFLSMSGGFWHSEDMINWAFVATPSLPNYDYAPDVREVDGALVVCASHPTKAGNFYRSADPLAGVWEEIPGSLVIWDPNLFQDDDGRLYLYWGCSNKTPIWGVELDRKTFRPLGERVALLESDTASHGWERTGVNHNPKAMEGAIPRILTALMGDAPYIEGPWMTKQGGRYYLQYSAPGTQINTYADGCYMAETPLGPLTYSPHSPFSSKPGGFMPAAGHGSTFQDRHGNWWHAATMRISKNHMFERRIGIFPAGFDADGVLFCNQEFADYPMAIPDGPADPWSLSAQAMLLSYKRPVTASSAAANHPASFAVDEDCTTWWVAEDATRGHWLCVDLGEGAHVQAIQVNFADHRLQPPKIDKKNRRLTALWQRYIDPIDPPQEFLLEGSLDGKTWTVLRDARGGDAMLPHDYVVLPAATPYRFVRLTAHAQPYGGAAAVSGLRVFGRGAGAPPPAVTPSAVRVGPLNARIEWPASPGAHGYNVCYGLGPNTLYKSWLLYGQTHLDLGALNAGHEYWVTVDAFNANGVTRGAPVVIVGG